MSETDDPKTRKEKGTLEVKRVEFTSKEKLYYLTVDKYFRSTSKKNVDKMVNIIAGKSKISLRLLDWFVTRYAKKYKINYYIEEENERFNVHIGYKAQLKSFKKKYFDPFRRKKKFNYNNVKDISGKPLYTTIGQLNFFKWVFGYKIINYVEEKYEIINNAMIKSNKDDKKRKLLKSETSGSESSVTMEQKTASIGSKKGTIKIQHRGIAIKADKEIKNDKVKIVLSFD